MQNTRNKFIGKLVEKEGYILWDKAIIQADGNRLNRGNASSSNTVIILPFVYKDEKKVSAFLACSLNEDKVTMKMYRARMYSKLKFENNHDSLNANTLALEFMYQNQRIFGDSIFSLTDARLFSNPNNKSKRRTVWLKSSKTVSAARSSTWIAFSSLRCYTSGGDDGNEGQVVGAAPGGSPDYPGGGTETCYVQTFYIFTGGGGGGSIPTSEVTISIEPDGGGGGGGSVAYSYVNNGYWWSDEPCPDPNGPQEPDPPSCNGGTVLGWQPTYMNAVSWTVGTYLALDQNKLNWLDANLGIRSQLWYYLFQSTTSSGLPEATRKANAVNHINRLIADQKYSTYNQNHQATTTIPNSVWWEDNVWLQSYGGISFGTWAISYLSLNPTLPFSTFQNWFFNRPEYTGGEAVIDPNQITYDQPLQQVALPALSTFETHFPKEGTSGSYTELSAPDVYQLVGGSLYQSHLNDPDNYSNACAIRGSRALLYAGIDIPVLKYGASGQRTQKGGDNKNYILDAVSFNKFMIDKFGDTPHKLTGADANDPQKVADLLKDKNGIYVIINNDGTSAGYSGHVDLILNGECISSAYTTPSGGVKSIRVWVLN